MGNKCFIFLLFLTGCIQTVWCIEAMFSLETKSLLQMQQGIGWPRNLHVAEGHEALIKLSKYLDNQESCIVITPSGQTFNVNTPPNSRFESWSDTCGVRIRNVQLLDEGRWRLTSLHGNDSLTGWSEIHVRNATNNYTGDPINLQDGQSHSDIQLSSLDNAYCVVAQPFSEGSLVSGKCKVTLDRATRAVQGKWHMLLGLQGQVSELKVERVVNVETERLDVGFIHDSNKLHLYCNILHTTKNITFCRFQKTSSTYGHNVIDGLSDGVHSYYGNGFLKRQCGMTIENYSAQDYGTWRCSVGVQQWVGQHIVQQTPMQALIRVEAPNTRNTKRIITNSDETERNIFVQESSSFSISCRADVSLMYCWFQHPNGSQFTPVPQVDDSQQFWYSGESLQMGDCKITFMYASVEDSGKWTCHMGPSDQMGLEITDDINVRVTGALAANEKDISVVIGTSTTLYCHSSNGNRVLQYCRFMSPQYRGFNIDSTVTQENAILDRYYFTPERSLDYGDCSLTISPVEAEDIGYWTCAAVVDDDAVESRDTIYLFTDSRSNVQRGLTQAGVLGMSIGLVILAVALGGVVWVRRGRQGPLLWRRARASPDDATVAYNARLSNSTASTGSGDTTNNQITFNAPNY